MNLEQSAIILSVQVIFQAASTVFFGGMGERLEITHHSYNWECFARGACDCAAYLDGKAPGFYSIKDVLGL